MKIICSNNPNHDKFAVTVQVAQDWEVDEYGNFLECIDECSEVYESPSTDHVYECMICGATATAR